MDVKEDLVEPAIARIAPYEPGKPIEELERELGRGPGGIIKLASNENPYGPSPLGVAAVQKAAAQLNLYPDGSVYALRHQLAQRRGVDPQQILVGAGSNELIDLLVQTFCAAGEEVLAPQYSFVAYKLAAAKNRRPFREVPVGPQLALDLEALAAAVRPETKLIFLANPNNPTGAYAGRAAFERLLAALPPRVLLVVDEAYFEYATVADYPDACQYLTVRERLVSLRTFSKIYGLAGLRVGYAVGSAALCEHLNRVRTAFNVSSLAQVAAVAALDDEAHLSRSKESNAVELPRLAAALQALGLTALPSQTNFLLVDFGPRDGREVYQRLLRAGVIVRPMNGYGLPHHLRITVGTPDENARLVEAVRATL